MPSLASEMGQNSCSAEWVIYMEKAIEKVFTFEQGRKKKTLKILAFLSFCVIEK